MFTALLNALGMAFAMGWEILWPLVLVFALSAVIQAIVSRREMSRLLPDDRPRSIGIALALGAASSSCSYAAVAIARSIFRKGANCTAATAFEIASTNLVLELSIILIVLMGWQFMAAEAIAAPIMVAILAVLFRLFLRPQLLQAAKDQAEKGIAGRMEGHAKMDMSVPAEGSLWRRITSDRGLTAVSHYFVMDFAAVWMDIVGGLVIAGAIAAWVPQVFWNGPERSSGPGYLVGADRRAARRYHFLRLLGRKHSPRCRAVERRHQLRRCACIHLGRPDRPADFEHLPQVLWAEDGRIPARDILYRDGVRCPCC